MQVETGNKKRKIQEISDTKAIQNGEAQKSVNDGGKKGRAQNKSQPKRQSASPLEIVKASDDQPAKKRLRRDSSPLVEETDEEQEAQISSQLASQVIINQMFSIYSIADKNPGRIKSIIDQIFKHKQTDEVFIVKTMFLYFLELMGLAEKESLDYFCNFIAKNDDTKKLLALFGQDEKLDISWDKLVFFSQEKKAVGQKRLLKKVCRLFIANMVDVLPDKANYLTSVVEKVCVFAQSQQRLVRYAFTYVGLYIYKFLLNQYKDMSEIKKHLDAKFKNEKKLKLKDEANTTAVQIEAIEEAMAIIKGSFEIIQTHIVLKRSKDCADIVRKSVYEFFLQMEHAELMMAFSREGCHSELYNMVFQVLREDDLNIKKIALQIIINLYNHGNDPETQKLLNEHVTTYKIFIFKLAVPTEKHTDIATILRGLQLIGKALEHSPELFNKDYLQILFNLVHFQNQQVREEVANILLIHSQEFDDQNSLLEFQKVKNEATVLNFVDEPNKSSKQIIKLIKMFEKHVQTRSQYIKSSQGADSEIPDSQIVVPKMTRDQVKTILQGESEERALLIFQTFQRKTSVVYDVQSICTLLRRDEVEPRTLQVLSFLLDLSVTNIERMKAENLTFKKINETTFNYLNWTVMNQMIQLFRESTKILEPLLRVLVIFNKTIQQEAKNDNVEEMTKDMGGQLMKMLYEIEMTDAKPETHLIVRNLIIIINQLQRFVPLLTKQLKEISLNLNEQFKKQVAPKIFNSSTGKPSEEVFSFLHKLNVLMSYFTLQQLVDTDYLIGMTSFAVTNFSQMILDNVQILGQLTRNELVTIIQIPFYYLDQLLSDTSKEKLAQQEVQFQTLMMHSLADFYFNLYENLKNHESHQVAVLTYLVETMLLLGGENRSNTKSSFVILGLQEFPRIKELLNELIQLVSLRIKGGDTIVLEQFQILLNLFRKDFNCLISETGVEFMIYFGTSRDPLVLKEMRKLYQSYKQRDRLLLDTKKGIFYSFLFKCILAIYNLSDQKAQRIAETAKADIKKELITSGLDKFDVSEPVFMRLTGIQAFVKNFFSAVMLQVISVNQTGMRSNGLTRSQDEFAYFKLVEQLIRQSLSDSPNVYLLFCVKTFLHKNFLNLKNQELLIKGTKSFYEIAKPKLIKEGNEKLDQFVSFALSKMEERASGFVVAKKASKKVDEPSMAVIEEQEKPETEKKDQEISLEMVGKKRKGQADSSANAKDAKQEKSMKKKKLN